MMKGKKGESIIEILLSVSLLAIITVSFFPMFNVSYSSIYNDGAKNQAMANIASKMELLYTLDSVNVSDPTITALFVPNIIRIATDTTDLYDPNPTFPTLRFFRENGSLSGYKVTLVMFYGTSGNYVSLTSFFKDKVIGGV